MIAEWTSVGERRGGPRAPDGVCIKVLEKNVDDTLSSILVVKSVDCSRG